MNNQKIKVLNAIIAGIFGAIVGISIGNWIVFACGVIVSGLSAFVYFNYDNL